MRRGFALIYVLLLVALISITIVAVTTSTLSDMRQAKRVDNTTEVYQLAQAGLEDALVKSSTSTCPNGGPGSPFQIQLPPYGSYYISHCDDDYVAIIAIHTDTNGNSINKMGLKYDKATKVVSQVWDSQ